MVDPVTGLPLVAPGGPVAVRFPVYGADLGALIRAAAEGAAEFAGEAGVVRTVELAQVDQQQSEGWGGTARALIDLA